MQTGDTTIDKAGPAEGVSSGTGKNKDVVDAAVQAAIETMNSVMSNPPEGFSKVDIMQQLLSQMQTEFKAEVVQPHSIDFKAEAPAAQPVTPDTKPAMPSEETHEEGPSTMELEAEETLDLKVDSVASSAGLSLFLLDSFGHDRAGPSPHAYPRSPSVLGTAPPIEGVPRNKSMAPAEAPESAIAASLHTKRSFKPAARGGSSATHTEVPPCTDAASDTEASTALSEHQLLTGQAQDRPSAIKTHSDAATDVTADCVPSAQTPPPSSDDSTAAPRPCMAEEATVTAKTPPSWAGSPRLPSPPDAECMLRAGPLTHAKKRTPAAKPPFRAGARRAGPPRPPAPRGGEHTRKTRPPPARPPLATHSAPAHGGCNRGTATPGTSGRIAPTGCKGRRKPPSSPAASTSGELSVASNSKQLAGASGRLPAAATAWPLPESAACRTDRRVVVEGLFRAPGTCTRWHLAAVVNCLPDSVRHAFLTWSEVAGRTRTESQRRRCARAVVRETKRLLHTLRSSPVRASRPSTAALDAALKEAIIMGPRRELPPRAMPALCCGDAAETYGLLISSFKTALTPRGVSRGPAIAEVEASSFGGDVEDLGLTARQLSAMINGDSPTASGANRHLEQDLEQMRPLKDSQVLLVERLVEDRVGVACMPLMRVAVEALRAAPHGGGFAGVLAGQLRNCLRGPGGEPPPTLLQAPATVTVEFEWRSLKNTCLLLPHAEFLPHFFSKGCRFDLQQVVATADGESLPFHARRLVLWRGARYMTVDAEGGAFVITGASCSGRAPSWEAVQKFCLDEGWRPKLVVYEHAA